ncbi:8189_t:CDS:1 [Diversispora eburnea]|uniref:8189_t:CDS:1 n=1 Tax=Diversispora eburnea TaxID=1213867 RepID=A0A9N9B721_9GLOM|nr:8189_t:CDS:1 [Diversispora eburnea]
MATKIPTEILFKILNNLQSPFSTQDLYSSLLVNRFWCKVTIPMLWELPLGQDCMDYNNLRKKALCIRTYLSCMDTQARTLLIQNGFDLSSSPSQAIFDYPSFTHKLRTDNLIYFISRYSEVDDNSNNEIIITKSRILFLEICKLIINRCSFLDSFKLTRVKFFIVNVHIYNDLIGSILELPSAPKVIKKLESFTLLIEDNELIFPLYESLTLVCDNILNMDLEFNSYSQAKLLAKLISVQKYLEDLSIVVSDYKIDYLSILLSIISQKETLKSFRLRSVSFYYSEWKSLPIGQFISLQNLYIENCFGLHESDNLFFASSFPQLSSFHFRHIHDRFPQDFIIKIFETSNTKLRDVYLNSLTTDTFLAILNYCTNITKLTLHDLRPEHVIAIFNNNFNELRRFSFDCGGEGFDANELLCQMAKNVPESLETIEIRMGIFSADSLRKFLEGWCRKGGGGNRKIIVRRMEQERLFTLSDEHFKVIEEYGVQIDLEE